MLVELLSSVATVWYYILLDALNVANRLWVPFVYVLGGFWPTASPEAMEVFQGTWLFGICGTLTASLVVVACGALRLDVGPMWLAGGILLLDSIGQLLGLLLGGYPTSKSLLFVFWAGLTIVPIWLPRSSGRGLLVPYHCLTGGLVALIAAGRLFVWWDNAAGAVLFTLLAIPPILFAITPQPIWHNLCGWLQRLGTALTAFATSVWLLLVKVWPVIQQGLQYIWALLTSDLAMFIKRAILEPLWRKLSPLCLPMTTGAIAWLTARSILLKSLEEHSASPLHVSLQVFSVLAASMSTVVLSAHALGRVFYPGGFDVLRFVGFCAFISGVAWVLQLPFLAVRWVFFKVMQGRVLRFLLAGWAALLRLAAHHPVPALLLALPVNGLALWVAYATPVGVAFSALWHLLQHMFFAFCGALGELSHSSLEHSADSTLAMAAVVLSQTMIFFLVKQILAAAWPRHIGDDDTDETLDAIAAGLSDPRQCGRCAFGPVDYDGCSILRTHHRQARSGGGEVSNACPRCQWFVPSLERWPYWSPGHQLRAGTHHVLRVRAWSEIVCAVRAASKAIIFPFLTLRLLESWDKVGAVLALGFLGPWLLENAATFDGIYAGSVYGGPRYPRRNIASDPPECRRAPDPLPQLVTPGEALDAIAKAAPPRIFLGDDVTCSICLDEFDEAALEAVSSADPAAALRALDPPVVTLPCGHPLHMACAQQLIETVTARHMRCPLCREPISLAGTLSARVFN